MGIVNVSMIKVKLGQKVIQIIQSHKKVLKIIMKDIIGYQFGTKIMAQSRGAVRFLKDKPLHCFTSYGDHGWVWMNLETFDGTEVKAKPVKLQSGLPNSLIEKLHVKRKWPREL